MSSSSSTTILTANAYEELFEFAHRYYSSGIAGFVCVVVVLGSAISHSLQSINHIKCLRGFVSNYVLIGGSIGYLCMCIFDFHAPKLSRDFNSAIKGMKLNSMNYAFAALILGLTCTRANSQHVTWRGIFTSLFHEGVPMIIFSQILIWGQSMCCILCVVLLRYCLKWQVSVDYAILVPMAIEVGEEVNIVPVVDAVDGALPTSEELESIGLVVTILIAIFLFHNENKCNTISSWINDKITKCHSETSSRQRLSSDRDEQSGSKICDSSSSPPKIFPLGVGSPTESHDRMLTHIRDDVVSASRGEYSGDKTRFRQNTTAASMGLHFMFVAVSVVISFGLIWFARLIEIEMGYLDHQYLSGSRIYKVSAFVAFLLMHLAIFRIKFRFKRDWYMSITSFLLDVMCVCAVAGMTPVHRIISSNLLDPNALHPIRGLHPIKSSALVGLIFVVVCAIWNVGCLFVLAKHFFPNFWFKRGIILIGDAMAHPYTGLWFARSLDSTMLSPASCAYAFKQMLFFIPSSGMKRAIVSNLLHNRGPLIAFCVCAAIVGCWFAIFDACYKGRYLIEGGSVLHQKSSHRSEPISGIQLDVESTDSLDGFLATRDQDVLSPAIKSGTNEDFELIAVQGGNLPSGATTPVIRPSKLSSVDSLGEGSSTPKSDSYLSDSISLSALIADSDILSAFHIHWIKKWLPSHRSYRHFSLRYSLRKHGASIDTMLSQCGVFNTTMAGLNDQFERGRSRVHSLGSYVIVIEDSWGYKFGGYIATPMQYNANYYGNGESFVFTFSPTPSVFRWTGVNNFFLLTNSSCFAMGGGGGGFALQIDDALDTGVSNQSATYGNSQLSSSEFFKCLNVEVWELQLQSGDV